MISVQNLGFTYPGATAPTLTNLGFEIGKGEVYGLLGPSGAGKSTTQKILMGLLAGFSGTARLFGEDVASLGRAIYERIGVSFELPTLYLRLTARENLALFAALYDRPTKKPEEVLAVVDLQDAADQRVETFSKGMKMRLNLCRALLHDPELLFLDEPTTGQDPARARVTRELILRLKGEGKTIFLTTHNMAEADEVCDRVGFLSGGHIPVTGTPANLKRQFGRRYLAVDARDGDAISRHEFSMEGLGANAEFRTLLEADRIASMHTLEASLDDVFIKATGGGATVGEAQ
ncbi:MAG: ABC transporter ATP-binding protein [Hyphomicrobiaceae bacterium]|nr:ABC transporter ATP-binding protein [Hyphomicrobiaceae bacterium]